MTRNKQIKEAAIGRYGNNGNESQYMLAKVQAFMVGARWADEHPNGSQIKWQTGEPKVKGSYIITTDEGTIALASFYPDNSSDVDFFRICVTAWCKLSDIEPYKKETK